MAFEILILVFVIVAVVVAYYILKKVTTLFINAILGLILLAISNYFFNANIEYTIPALLICALGGVPGAVLVIILHFLNIAF